MKKPFLKISQNSQENRSKPATLSKKRLRHKCLISCKFCEIFKDTFLIEHLQWLLILFIQLSKSLNKTVFLKFLKVQLSSWNFDSKLKFHAVNQYLLKALQNCFLHIICVVIILFSISLCKSVFFLPIRLQNWFFFFRCFLCFLPVL